MKNDKRESAIIAHDIHKAFHLPHENHSGIKQRIINLFRKDRKKGYEVQKVLKGVSFDIKRGEFFGIVGRNGSGKSTLLKILAGVYTPDSGGLTINGSLIPFIELGVGFNPELTGRENVFLNGALLGFSHKEMETMYDDIIEFAELEKFMDQKLKNYSSGMQVRLAFSIAIRADSDILLLDEVLAVGDEAFQRKCYAYFSELKENNKTVILVTHSMESIQQFCDRALLIDKGHKTELGTPGEIAAIYKELNMPKNANQSTKKVNDRQDLVGDKLVYLDVTSEIHKDKISFDFNAISKVDIDDASLAMNIQKEGGEIVYRWSLDEHKRDKTSLSKGIPFKLKLTIQNIFPDGMYSVTVAVRKRDRSEDYILINGAIKFNISRAENGSAYWKPKEVLS